MKKLIVKNQDGKYLVFSNESLLGEISFDNEGVGATLKYGESTFRAEQGEDKNIVLKENEKLLFTFKFDYIWGGAEIVPFGETSQYEIKGRWFKPGTRLVDQDDCDLIITEKKDNCLEVTLCEENISNTMMLATIYYHVYTSRGKMLSIII